MKKEDLYVVMFSGGRTSAFLSKYIKENPKYKNKVFIFCNTGKERKETLDFVNKCDVEFGLNTVWLEARIEKEKGVGTKHNIVNYQTYSKNGEPFEAMLEKYPMPNTFVSNCTRELKQRPSDSYIRSIAENYNVIKVIGIRSDEAHRKSNNAVSDKIIYPLCDELPVDSKFIREWWEKQSFDLELKDYEGNCDLCFKKSLKKRLTIIKENPSVADWWIKMENKYGSEQAPRFDLRSNVSIEQLVEMAKQPFQKAEDLHELSKQQQSLFDYETDCFCKAN
jgi:hypothetical protein